MMIKETLRVLNNLYDLENQEMVCEFCGSTKNVFLYHFEEHLKDNPREITVCKSCHTRLHHKGIKLGTRKTIICPSCGSLSVGLYYNLCPKCFRKKHNISVSKFFVMKGKGEISDNFLKKVNGSTFTKVEQIE